jgi:sialate O-acetylesterase
MTGSFRRNVLMIFACVLLTMGRAEVTLAGIFSDHMVLQSGLPMPVWGVGTPGTKVTVSFRDQDRTVTVGPDGRWQVELAPLAVAWDPAELTVAAEPGRILRVRDVLVGEVWLCAGQSNMERTVAQFERSAQIVDTARDSHLRHIKIGRVASEQPETNITGAWEASSLLTAGNFSAVAFHFGRHLRWRLNVPVGLINLSWGGTPIESFLSPRALAESGLRVEVEGRWGEIVASYPRRHAAYEESMARWREAAKRAAAEFQPPPRVPSVPPGAPGHRHQPGSLHNGMVAPLEPFPVAGCIWYQGESNAARSDEYTALFGALIDDWRRVRGEGWPFYFVQLPGYGVPGDVTGESWARLREAQSAVLGRKGTGMAVVIDLGDRNDIHPQSKETVGRRLALLALARTYGQELEDSGPVLVSAVREGEAMRLSFGRSARGLVLRDGDGTGFELAGADRKFHPAEVRLNGNELMISAAGVRDPAAVRYAWSNLPVTSLFNTAGLPAAPFRTDNW